MCDAPGKKAIEDLNKVDNPMVEFKKPSDRAVKKYRPKILTEEKYIEELSKIIQRDFFPDLDKLNAQNDYLDAMDRKDFVKMASIRAKFSGGQYTERTTGRMTPATFETPAIGTGSTPRKVDANVGSDTPKSTTSNTSSASVGSKKSISSKHSLDSFLQAYTSEDNNSFQEIIDVADERLRQKFAVLYNEEKLSADKLARALTLPTIEQQFEPPDPMRKIETWNYTNKNSIMYIPDGVDLTEAERLECVNRRQTINHSSTRLSSNPFAESCTQRSNTELARSQSQLQNDKIGVDGNTIQNSNGPHIRGFELVKTPSPRPGGDFSPLMTWGEIEGTPFRLDGSDTPFRPNTGPSFKINETSRRETIALELAEKVGVKMRAQKQRAMDTARKNIGSPFIRSNMERLSSMSPAARRLATGKFGVRTPTMTPPPLCSPLSNAKATAAKRSRVPTAAVAEKTPSVPPSSRASTPKQISTAKCTLTDDLLKIPTKRLKASDFF